jgi:hypothetical protein
MRICRHWKSLDKWQKLPKSEVLKGFATGSGGGTRTPDTRIMMTYKKRRNPKVLRHHVALTLHQS